MRKFITKLIMKPLELIMLLVEFLDRGEFDKYITDTVYRKLDLSNVDIFDNLDDIRISVDTLTKHERRVFKDVLYDIHTGLLSFNILNKKYLLTNSFNYGRLSSVRQVLDNYDIKDIDLFFIKYVECDDTTETLFFNLCKYLNYNLNDSFNPLNEFKKFIESGVYYEAI